MKFCFILKISIILIVEMTAFSAVISQSGYKKIISIENSLLLDIDDIIYQDDHLFLRGNCYVDSAHVWGLFIAKLDTNGIVQWHKIIYDTIHQIVTNTPSKFIISKSKYFIIPSAYFYQGNIVLFITDSLGNKMYSNEYENTERTIFPMNILEYMDNNYIVGFIQRLNYLNDIFIIKTDSIGNFKWIKYYGTTSDNENFGDVIQHEDGSMTFSSSVFTSDYFDNNPLQGYKKPWIFTVDTSGNIKNQWQGVWNDTRTLGGGPFCHTLNGDWVIVSYDRKKFQITEFITEFRYSPTITRLDSNFNLLWKINLTDFTGKFDRIRDLTYDTLHDEVILTGNLLIIYSPQKAESNIWSLKVNKDGDILWNKLDTIAFENTGDPEYNTAGVAMSPSGSLYVSGWVDILSGPTLEYGWIMKITPDGCTDTICTTTSIADQIRRIDCKINLFPNPLSDELNISIKELVGKSEILLYDVYGRVTMRRDIYTGNNSFPVNLPDGIYFYSILNESILVSSGKLIVR